MSSSPQYNPDQKLCVLALILLEKDMVHISSFNLYLFSRAREDSGGWTIFFRVFEFFEHP